MNKRVPTPFINNTIPASIPNKIGTNTDAPNIAKVCCKLSGINHFNGTFSSIPMIFLLLIKPPIF